MSFKQRWETLPTWVQVVVYTVLGIIAFGVVGYLGVLLTRSILGTSGAQGLSIWELLGGGLLITIIFGGTRGTSRRRKDKS